LEDSKYSKSCRFTIAFDGRKSCGEDNVWDIRDFVSPVVGSGIGGKIIGELSRLCVIGITHDDGDADFISLLDTDGGSSSTTFCSLNPDDFCEFDFSAMLLYAKQSGHSFRICNHFPFRVSRLSWIDV
jgi:hypothetical protein